LPLYIDRTRDHEIDMVRVFFHQLDATGNKNHWCELSTESAAKQGWQIADKKHDLIDQKLQDLNNDGIDRAARHRFFSVGNAGIACLSGFARRS